MTDPLSRFKALVGGEEAFNKLEADAKQKTSKSAPTIAWDILLQDVDAYIDPAEHDRVSPRDALRAHLWPAHLAPAQSAHKEMKFMPFWVVKKLAEALTTTTTSLASSTPKASSKFFDSVWHIYYIASRFSAHPQLLVPTSQVETYFRGITDEKADSCRIQTYRFSDPQIPSPKALGRTVSRHHFDRLYKLLLTSLGPFNANEDAKDAALVDEGLAQSRDAISRFQDRVERITLNNEKAIRVTAEPQVDWRVLKSNNRSVETKAEQKRWCGALLRSQRYLGLRGTEDLTPSTSDIARDHAFDLDAIIVCIDVEADEQNHDHITEVGIAMLDTRDLKNVSPGADGKGWLEKIRGRHIRVAERLHIRNHLFVTGDPTAFDKAFGSSEIVPLSETADKVRECFEAIDDRATTTEGSVEKKLRNIVLVGHSVKGDIRWLSKLGFKILDLTNLVEVLTTEDLQKALKHDRTGGTTLAKLLQEMDIDAWNLHNAGNDAVYTLQAMVAIAFKAMSDTRPIVSLEERVQKAMEKAKLDAEKEWNGWCDAEVQARDGGKPVPFAGSSLRG